MALTTVEKLAAYVAVDMPSAAQMALLEQLVAAASASFETMTGRKFEVASYTDTFIGDAAPSRQYVPRRDPLISVSAVTVDGAPALEGWRVIDGVVVLVSGQWFAGDCSVTYTAGYATTPADAEQAVLELAAWRYNARKMATTGGEVGFVPVLQVPASIVSAVNSYKAWRIA